MMEVICKISVCHVLIHPMMEVICKISVCHVLIQPMMEVICKISVLCVDTAYDGGDL